MVERRRQLVRDRERRRHQLPRVVAGRVGEHLLGRALLDHLARAHDHDLMRHRPHHPQVVADEQEREAVFRLQPAQQVDDLHLNRHVERARRLVQHHDLRPQDHRPRDRDPLPLPARKLVRIAVHRRRVQPDLGHDPGDHVAPVSALFDAVDAQPLGDDLADRHSRRQAAIGVLEHDLHIAPQRPHLPTRAPGDVLAHEQDRSPAFDQPHDGERERRLARPGFAHDPQRLARAHRERRAVHGLDVTHRAAQQPALDREPDLQVAGRHDLGRVGGHGARAPGRLGRQQLAGVGVLRVAEDVLDRALLDDLAALHHADPVGDAAHDAQVVADEQHRQPFVALEFGQKVQDLRLDRHVERRRRLVRDQKLGPVRQRHRDHHPLPLPARKLVRVVGKAAFGIADADAGQKLDRAGAGGGAGQALVQRHAFGQLLFDRVQRVERGHRLLEDEADVVAADGAQLRLGRADQLGAVVADAARDGRGVAQKLDRGQRGHRLAGPGFADQRHRLAPVHGEADAAHGMCDLAVLLEADPQVAHVEDGAGGGAGPGRCPGPRDTCTPPEAVVARRLGRDGGRLPRGGDHRRGQAGGRVQRRCGVAGICHRKVLRGSKASRIPSNTKTRRDSMIAKVKKAEKPSHGACRFCLA